MMQNHNKKLAINVRIDYNGYMKKLLKVSFLVAVWYFGSYYLWLLFLGA